MSSIDIDELMKEIVSRTVDSAIDNDLISTIDAGKRSFNNAQEGLLEVIDDLKTYLHLLDKDATDTDKTVEDYADEWPMDREQIINLIGTLEFVSLQITGEQNPMSV